MSREIKFRAWHSGMKRIVSCEELTQDQMSLLADGHFANPDPYSTARTRVFTHEEMVPLQFTGLKDKNGVEIYEGDILILGCSTNGEHYIKGKVIWHDDYNPGFGVDFLDGQNLEDGFGRPVTAGHMHSWVGGHSCLSNYYASRYHEIIGNIYENAELLEVK